MTTERASTRGYWQRIADAIYLAGRPMTVAEIAELTGFRQDRIHNDIWRCPQVFTKVNSLGLVSLWSTYQLELVKEKIGVR